METQRNESNATRQIEQTVTQQRYVSPELKEIGAAARIVQGCGGSSGSDRSAYRIFCGGE